MKRASPIEAVLQRDRVLLGGGLLAITALAWLYMAHEARIMARTGVCACFGLKMTGPDLQGWGWVEGIGLFLMWTEMMVAMMVPTAAPMILTFAALNRRRREQERPFVRTSIFLLGYLVVWTGFSVLATAVQWALHTAALLSPRMVSTSPILGGGLLIITGIFQWTPLKHRCMAHCRSPLSFFTTDWREGRRGAFWMGLKQGAYCTGCCWLLMLLLFVLGVMNLWWIAVLTAFVLIEKLSPRPVFLNRLSGMALMVWGAWMLGRS